VCEARAVKVTGRDSRRLEQRLLADHLKARQLGCGAGLPETCLDRGDLLGARTLLQVLELRLRSLKLLRGLPQGGALGHALELKKGCARCDAGSLGYEELVQAPPQG